MAKSQNATSPTAQNQNAQIISVLIGIAIGIVTGGVILIFMAMSMFQAAPTPVVATNTATPVASVPTQPTQPAPVSTTAPSPVPATAAAPPEAAPAPPAAPSADLVADTTMPPEQLAELRHKLKQIGIAFHNHESVKRSFPGGPKSNPELSWRVYLLPYIEEKPLYDRFRLDEPWNSPHNLQLATLMPDIYRTADGQEETHFLVFTGENTPFRPERAFQFHACRDGTSKTLLVVHTGGGKTSPWTKPDDIAFDPAHPLAGIGPINGRIESLMMDASAHSLPGDLTPANFAALVTPAGNELIDPSVLRNPAPTPVAGAAGPRSSVASQANQFSNRMHTVARAMQDFHDTRKAFPAAATRIIRDGQTSPEISWRVMTLPFMEEDTLFKRYERNEPWDGPTNSQLLGFRPEHFAHPADQDTQKTRLQVLLGPGTAFEKNADEKKQNIGPNFREMKDGTSKTIMFVASGADRAVPWLEPRDLEFDPANPLSALGTVDPAGTPVAMVDGSVRMLAPDVDPQVFKSMVLKDDGK